MSPSPPGTPRPGLFQAARVVAHLLRARIQLRGTRQGARVRSVGRLIVPRPEGVSIGQRTVFLGGPIPTSLRCAPGAELEIGERCVVNYGVDVSANSSVRIGQDCMIGSLVHIRDDDGRRKAPVVIGKGVWIAYGAVIEPGTVLGDGSVVSAMAVVSGVVPPRCLAAGNPAKWLPLDGAPSPAEVASTETSSERTPEVVRRAVIEWLDETRYFGAAESLVTSDTISLRESGLLDSLGMVELLLFLERRFGVVIDRQRAGRPEAQTLRSIVELVRTSRTLPPPSAPSQPYLMPPPSAGPSRAVSQLSDFARFVRERTGLALPVGDYAALHDFSTDELSRFWSLFLEWSEVKTDGEREPATVGEGIVETRFFPRLRLSWPETMLATRSGHEDDVAIVSVDETGARAEITRAALRKRVRHVAAGLAATGLAEGDRVAAIARNTLETLVACLAVTSLGASFSSLALDMGPEAALARLKALEPKVLLAHSRTRQNGAAIELPLGALAPGLPSLESLVWLDPDGKAGPELEARLRPTTLQLVERDGERRLSGRGDEPWPRFPFDHPLFILFSSGTTGAPKAIVHGHGGTLLEHLKEHRLHVDLGPSDTLCFNTSTGWMMWNWTVSALGAGARVVLYDGSVSYPGPDALLRMAEREGVTVLGISPAYLRFLIDAGVPSAKHRLRRVRTMLSTGSVLTAPLHRWANEHLVDAPLESISGGTDILGCFVMGSPWSPTHEGESSSLGLGFDLHAWTDGSPMRPGTGELVCTQPFPSRPVGFLKDPDGARLRKAYYDQHPGVWTHGDLVELTTRGTARVLGRSDGVLNIRGIRIGPAEIYDVLERAVPEVAQAMAIDADAPDEPGGKRLVLFVVLRGGATLDRELTFRIKRELKTRASAVHVPSVVVAVGELPATFSNKLSEAALQDALSGRPVRNLQALRNPGSIQKAVEAWRQATSSHA